VTYIAVEMIMMIMMILMMIMMMILMMMMMIMMITTTLDQSTGSSSKLSLLDYGCGSAILALAACKFGVRTDFYHHHYYYYYYHHC